LGNFGIAFNFKISAIPQFQNSLYLIVKSYPMEQVLKSRTKKFAIEVLKLVDKFPSNKKSANIIANQLGRSASSIAANYRAACRARSHNEFIAKIGIVEEEADESIFWLEVAKETNNLQEQVAENFLKEAKELTAIFTASAKTSKKNRK
jgi:four helix bundle protein